MRERRGGRGEEEERRRKRIRNQSKRDFKSNLSSNLKAKARGFSSPVDSENVSLACTLAEQPFRSSQQK